MVYGDALSAFWEKEAQEHIAKKLSHRVSRLISAVGATREGTSLKCGAPPGISPENGRGTYSFGFADLEYSVNFNLSLSTVYQYGDLRWIFAQGNQEQLRHLVSEVLKHCGPTLERIDEGISCWPAVNKNIIAVNGAVVGDCNFRTGHRVLLIDGKSSTDNTKTCKTKLKKRGLKDSLAQVLVCHPLLKEAERVMLGLLPLPPAPRRDRRPRRGCSCCACSSCRA